MYCTILSGSSHPKLAKAIAQGLGAKVARRRIGKFPNGEISVQLLEKVAGTVIIVQSLATPIHRHIVEMLLLADAAGRRGANQVIGVIPWLAYSKQDQAFLAGEPRSVEVVARMIGSFPWDQLVLVDLHREASAKFFSSPVSHLSALPNLTRALKQDLPSESIIIAPDQGAAARAKAAAVQLRLPLLVLSKVRSRGTRKVDYPAAKMEVKNRHCILIDDMVDTGDTLIKAATYLKQQGAQSISAAATHGLFSRGLEPVLSSPLDRLMVCDTLPQVAINSGHISVVSIAPAIAKYLKNLTSKA